MQPFPARQVAIAPWPLASWKCFRQRNPKPETQNRQRKYICRAAHQVHTLKPIESEVAGWVNRQWRILMNLNGFRLVLEQFYSYPHAISYGPYAYDLNRKTPSHNSATFGSRSWLLLGGCVWSTLSTHCRMLKRAIFQMSTCPIPDLFGSFCYQ